MKIRSLVVLLGLTICSTVVRAAPASLAEASPDRKPRPSKPPPKGMAPFLTVGLNFAFTQSQGVVGVPDGISMALGLKLQTGLDYRRRAHRWTTRLDVQMAVTKVPGIDPFITGTDLIELTSEYRYRFVRWPWLSLYGGIRARSKLLEGGLVRGVETRIQLTNTDGDVFTDVLPAQRPYPLTAFLAPLILEQAAGAGFRVLSLPAATLELGGGLVAHQVFTQGGYVARDDDATVDVIELIQMRDYVQGGAEARLSLSGAVADKLLGYRLDARVMFPFATSVGTALGYDRLINVELRAALSLRIFSWASLEYSLRVERMELLTPGWQVANLLMLSITASVGPDPRRRQP